MSHVKKSIVEWSAAIALLLAAGAGCSQAKSDTGGDLGQGSGNDDNSATSDDGTGNSSGSSTASSSGSSTKGGSSGTTSSSSGGASSGASSSGGGGVVDDAGLASTGPATDLEPPPAGTGIQIETPDYNANDPNAKQMIVTPNQEIFLCYYVTLPNNAEVDVGAFQSFMTEGSSHHFIVYQQGAGTVGGLFSGTQPNGTISPCVTAAGQWIYATSTPGEVVGMEMPQNVGYPIPQGTQLVLNMHFINTGTSNVFPKVKLNIVYAQNVKYKAAAMVSFNTQIDVPPATANGPGTQTVGGTCTAPVGSNFFIMSTHTHKHATAATVSYVHNGKTTEIVHTGATTTYPADQEKGSGTDWEHPGVGQWLAPNFLTTTAGDTFKYSCSFSNDASTAVTVGETAASNEMCMSIGYYYPAGTSSCN
jgi:hypothetical protein